MAETPETRYAQSGNVNIAYQILGSGPENLLLIGGNHISIDSMDEEPPFARFHRRLASFSRVIRFDRRGVGLSDPIAPSDPPTLEQLVEDALAVLDATGSSSAACFADGPCPEAILMAASHPERIRRLVLVNSTARVMRAPDYPCGIPEHLVTSFLDTVTRPDAVEQDVDDLALFNPSVAGDSAFRTWVTRAGRRGASPSVARAMMRVRWTADVRPVLPLVQLPTLVLHRAGLAVLRPEHGRYLAKHIPGSLYREIAGTDELYWVGETEPMLEEIEEFLTGARPSPEPGRVLATVLFTDIVDSTAQMSAVGDRHLARPPQPSRSHGPAATRALPGPGDQDDRRRLPRHLRRPGPGHRMRPRHL